MSSDLWGGDLAAVVSRAYRGQPQLVVAGLARGRSRAAEDAPEDDIAYRSREQRDGPGDAIPADVEPEQPEAKKTVMSRMLERLRLRLVPYESFAVGSCIAMGALSTVADVARSLLLGRQYGHGRRRLPTADSSSNLADPALVDGPRV
jgi:hypothetical protein